jgi:hypothetical protein
MPILLIVGIILIIITVIPLVAYYLGGFKPATLNQQVLNDASTAYNIPSAWTKAQPARDSPCQVYTFISSGTNIPQPSVSQLNLGATNIQPINSTCTDDDQVLAQKLYHICKYGEFQDTPASQFKGCPKIDGGNTKIDGYYEEFFNVCGKPTAKSAGAGQISEVTADNSTRCPGSVGLIMFNYQSSVDGAICLREPVYTTDGTNIIIDPKAPLTIAKRNNGPPTPPVGGGLFLNPSGGGCSIAETQNGFPSQLFRVVRHTFDTINFKVDNNGNWINIVHRPTGKYVAPYTLSDDPTKALVSKFIPSLSPILVNPNSFNGKGSWFYMTPNLIMPDSYIRGERPTPEPDPIPQSTVIGSSTWDKLYWKDEKRAAKPQIVWMPDPSILNKLKTNDELWPFLTNTKNIVYSMVPFVRTGLTIDYSHMSMTPFITYQIISGTSADTIKPLTDPTSIYYPTDADLRSYATINAANLSSGCYRYVPLFNGRLLPSPTEPGKYVFLPITWQDKCSQEYTLNLKTQYDAAVTIASERMIAEVGSFQYIDLTLYPIIMSNVASFVKTSV